MKIEWIGHSCFRLTAVDGTVVIADPYDDSVGIGLVPLEADLVTMSHNHHDHNFTGMLRGHAADCARSGARACGQCQRTCRGFLSRRCSGRHAGAQRDPDLFD